MRPPSPALGQLAEECLWTVAAAAAKLLRVNTDEGALRDLSFAAENTLGPAATLASLWRDLAGRPPSLDPGPIGEAATRLDSLCRTRFALSSNLKTCLGKGDPVSAASKTAALAFSACPDVRAAEAEILALSVFDLVLAIGLRWTRPVPLIATAIQHPTLRSPGAGRRPMPGDAASPDAAAGAIALAAVSALDLAADLARRSKTLIAVAPSLRAKPAAKIVALLLSQDCVSPAEAARQAPMTARAARRLFDRLVALGAARELTGRLTFRLYGL